MERLRGRRNKNSSILTVYCHRYNIKASVSIFVKFLIESYKICVIMAKSSKVFTALKDMNSYCVKIGHCFTTVCKSFCHYYFNQNEIKFCRSSVWLV